MSHQNIVGFETQSTEELFSTAGTYTLQTSVVRTGTCALRTNPTTTAVGSIQIRRHIDGGDVNINGANLYSAFYFRWDTKPTTNDEPIFVSRDSSSNQKLELRLNSSGNLAAYDSVGTLLATGSTVLSTATWYLIGVLVGTGASASWEVRIAGSTEISGSTANLGTSNNAHIRLGKWANRNGNSVDFYYDDCALDTTDWPADGKIVFMLPDSNGTDQDWTIGAGADHWSSVDEIPHTSDTDYLVSTLNTAHADTWHLASAATYGIGASDTIVTAKAIAIARRDGTVGGTVKSRIRQSSTTLDSANNGTGATYGLTAKLTDTDPATGVAWTPSGLDSVQVGVVEGETTDKSRVTLGGLMVFYTPAAGGASVPVMYHQRQQQGMAA